MKNQFILKAMVCLVALLYACGEEIVPPGSLSGVTLDGPEVVGSVKVQLSDGNGGAAGATSSSPQGLFSFPSLEPGSYMVSALASGYEDYSTQVTITEGTNTNLSIELVALTGNLMGTVSDVTDDAIENATVTLFESGTLVAEEITSGSGSFSFGNVSVGSYRLLVNKELYEEVSLSVTLADGDQINEEITLNALFAAVSGNVTNSKSSTALADVEIKLNQNDLCIAKTTTDANGDFSFQAVPFGTYDVEAIHPEFFDYTGTLTVDDQGGHTLNFEMDPFLGDLTISVYDNFSSLLPDANLALYQNNTLSKSYNMNSSTSTYTFKDMVPGSYQLITTLSGYYVDTTQVSVISNDEAKYSIQLSPESLPSAGLMNSITESYTGQTATFSLDLFVVDANSTPYTSLSASSFSIADANFNYNSSTVFFDFTTLSATLRTGIATPYSANLLLDQSGSITSTDPYDSRIQASKIFLSALGTGDQATVSAFSGNIANDVEIYGSFTSNGSTYYDELDALSRSEGGGTPLYDAVYKMIQYTNTNASNTNKAVVVFTDGDDTGSSNNESTVASLANSTGVKVFTVGLGSGTDVNALGELAEATGGSFMNADDARQLISMFGTLGNLLSGGLTHYRVRFQVSTASAVFPGWFTTSVSIALPNGATMSVPIYVDIDAQNINIAPGTESTLGSNVMYGTTLIRVPNPD